VKKRTSQVTKCFALSCGRMNALCPAARQVPVWLLTLLMLLAVPSSYALDAGFELSFSAHSTPSGRGGEFIDPVHSNASAGADRLDFLPGQTDFLTANAWGTANGTPSTYDEIERWQMPEVVVIDGKNYYHIVMGNLADGFIQETYIQMGYAFANSNATQPTASASMVPINGWSSASAGEGMVTKDNGRVDFAGNAHNPLAADAGNGSANPNKVIVWQINTDGEMYQEFKKESRAFKPVITQSIYRYGEIDAMFKIDMSNSTYADSGLEAKGIVNTLQLFGDNLAAPPAVGWNPDWGVAPIDSANFEMKTVGGVHVVTGAGAGSNVDVTGGKYVYVETADSLTTPGGSSGEYIYSNGSATVHSADWASFFRADDVSGNPWSYETFRPVP